MKWGIVGGDTEFACEIDWRIATEGCAAERQASASCLCLRHFGGHGVARGHLEVSCLLVVAGYDRDRCRDKLRMLSGLVATNDVITLQETYGHATDLTELLKVFWDLFGKARLPTHAMQGAWLFSCAGPLWPRLSRLFFTRIRSADRFGS